jgi:Flp pilus assembly pilin Flp
MTAVRLLLALSADETGAVLAEYALALGILSAASLTVLFAMGNQATLQMGNVQSTQLNGAQTPP